jgi:MarR family transcriptional regulator, organic hydroperoxide resistance regulator
MPVATLSFGNRVRALARRIDRAMLERIASHGLTVPQYHVLRELFGEEGITQRELSVRLSTTEPAVLGTLRRMEEQGLVRRERDPSDRRKINVSLAPRGRALRKPLRAHASRLNAAMRRGLSATEVRQFRALLARIEANLQERADG